MHALLEVMPRKKTQTQENTKKLANRYRMKYFHEIITLPWNRPNMDGFGMLAIPVRLSEYFSAIHEQDKVFLPIQLLGFQLGLALFVSLNR